MQIFKLAFKSVIIDLHKRSGAIECEEIRTIKQKLCHQDFTQSCNAINKNENKDGDH